MAKYQRRYKTGAEYRVQGAAKKERRLKFVGSAKLMGKEVLMFQPVRKAERAKNAELIPLVRGPA